MAIELSPKASASAEEVLSGQTSVAVIVIGVVTAVLHLMFASRYDVFRNELYFIVCGRHPDFGYVDQPPLVPLLAAATQAFGESIWLLRLPAVLAAASLPLVAAALARVLGGSGVSMLLAAAAVALSPGLTAPTATLTTSTFEPLAWTLCAYFFVRAMVQGERRNMVWAGIAAGVAMEAKYGIAMWLIGLAAGVLVTSARRIVLWPETWLGVALATLFAAPSLIWQAVHAWPFFSANFQPAVSGSAYLGTPFQFAWEQVRSINIVLAPLWLLGLAAPFLLRRLSTTRFLPIAALTAATINYLGGGKGYYLFPVYPVLFALGAAAFPKLSMRKAALWLTGAGVVFAAMAPVVLPILEPDVLAKYLDRTRLRPPPNEWAAIGAPLTQVFSDEMGWRELAQTVATVYRALPDEERRRAAILASNYGEAAAVDFYGTQHGLPPALSGANQYFLWGTDNFGGDIVIHIAGDPERWKRICQSVETVATFDAAYAMPYERDRPVFICKGLRMPLAKIWPRLRRF